LLGPFALGLWQGSMLRWGVHDGVNILTLWSLGSREGRREEGASISMYSSRPRPDDLPPPTSPTS
jgi:hypothetical protein